jgi:small subunit ribosomal protein S1
MGKDDFASLFSATPDAGRTRRLREGEVVSGKVVQVSGDSVFVDVGATKDARIPVTQLVDREGKVRVKVGDEIRATVVDVSAEVPELAVSLGGRGASDAAELTMAFETKMAISGKVTRAVKGGLEVEVNGVRAFCPASQVEIGFVKELEPFVGQSLEFRVLEIKDGGRSAVLSRRALLEDERREKEAAIGESLLPGTDLTGTVTSTNRHGAVVDVGGIEGFVHVSELAHKRVDRAEDVVNVGDQVEVRVIGVERNDKGLRVRLSMKQRVQPPQAAPPPAVDEVLEASVVRIAGSGVVVNTAKGEGLIPLRELGLAPGADHRRAFPTGKTFQVVLLDRDGRGRMRFSLVGVARVEEQKNVREFAVSQQGLGSLGDVLRKKLGLPEPPPEAPTPPAPAAPPAAAAAPAKEAPPPAPQMPRMESPPAVEKFDDLVRVDGAPPSSRREDPPGIVRRKR